MINEDALSNWLQKDAETCVFIIFLKLKERRRSSCSYVQYIENLSSLGRSSSDIRIIACVLCNDQKTLGFHHNFSFHSDWSLPNMYRYKFQTIFMFIHLQWRFFTQPNPLDKMKSDKYSDDDDSNENDGDYNDDDHGDTSYEKWRKEIKDSTKKVYWLFVSTDIQTYNHLCARP